MSVVAAPPLTRSARYRRLMESLSIRSEHSQIIPMRFSQSQEVLWQKVAPRLDAGEKLWFCVLKSRQVYASTFFQSLMFVRTISEPNTNSLVLAQDLFSSHTLFDMAKRFYDHFPMPKMRPATTQELSFPFPAGESRYRVISAGKAAKGRGANFTCVHASECAFYERPDVMLGLAQTLPDLPHTMWVLESTANGKRGPGEYFYNEWRTAISGESDLVPIFVPWFTLAKYRRRPGVPPDDWSTRERILVTTFGLDGEQLAWRRAYIKTKCQGDEAKFDQEYPVTPEVAFIATGTPAFSQDAVLAHRATVRDPADRGYLRKTGDRYRIEPDSRGWLRVWQRPQAGTQYVIGADTAEGIEDELGRGAEGDYACAQVLDMRDLTQVACVHGHIPPWDFADILNDLGRWYNNAVLAVEINNHGHSVQDRLIRELFYPMLHRWRGKPDRHLKMANASRIYGWECVDPDALILTADLQWVPACLIKTGHRILGCHEQPNPGRAQARHLQVQTVVAVREFMAPTVRVALENGCQAVVSATHPFLASRYRDGGWCWITASNLRPGNVVKHLPVWEGLRSYDAGRLSAFLDGEGHLSQSKQNKHGSLQMLVSQAEGPLAQEIVELWSRLGFDSTFKWVRHKRPHEKPVATSGVLKLPEVLHALGSLRPTRLLRRFAERVEIERLTVKAIKTAAVASVVPLGEGPVIGLTTDPDHTLIADGIVGHNTNPYSRPLMIDAGRRVINSGLVTIREEKLLDEISNFSMMDNGKYEAEYGHDDRVIAFLIALRSREENYYPARLTPSISAEREDPAAGAGVRIVEGREYDSDAQRQISKLLRKQAGQPAGVPWYYRKHKPDDASVRDRADAAVRNWMTF